MRPLQALVSEHPCTPLGIAGRAGLQPRRNQASRPLFVPRPRSLLLQAAGARDTGISKNAL